MLLHSRTRVVLAQEESGVSFIPRLLFGLVFALVMSSPSLLVADSIVIAGSDVVAIGDTFDVPVSVSGVSDLYAFQFDLSYDPTVLQLLSINEGSFLPSAGSTLFIPATIDNTAGAATSTADTLIGTIPGASGEGDLAIFDFKAISVGNSALTLSNVTLLDSSINNIAFTTTNGQVVSEVPEPNILPMLGLVLASASLAARKFSNRQT